MCLSLHFGDLFVVDQLLDERLILRDPNDLPVADQIGPTVSDLGEIDSIALCRRRREGRAEPLMFGVGNAFAVN